MESKSIGVNATISLQNPERMNPKMTFMLLTQNERCSILSADSWNNTSSTHHFIKKIIFNKKNKIVIGWAGENSKRTPNGTIRYVSEYLEELCSRYDGTNIEQIRDELWNESVNYLLDLHISINSPAVLQYFVIYFDKIDQSRKVMKLEIVKRICIEEKAGQMMISPAFSSSFFPDDNYSCTAFGVYSSSFNAANKTTEFWGIDEGEMLKRSRNYVQSFIDYESGLSDFERSVGGRVQSVCMGNDGGIIEEWT